MAPERSDRTIDEGGEPSLDDLFRVMADRHRRVALYYLLERDRVSVPELVDVVTGWTHASDGAVARRDDRERISTGLRTVHFPTMEAANVVAVDREADDVTLADLPGAHGSFVRWSATVETPSPPT